MNPQPWTGLRVTSWIVVSLLSHHFGLFFSGVDDWFRGAFYQAVRTEGLLHVGRGYLKGKMSPTYVFLYR